MNGVFIKDIYIKKNLLYVVGLLGEVDVCFFVKILEECFFEWIKINGFLYLS